jgi:hypothetical protein
VCTSLSSPQPLRCHYRLLARSGSESEAASPGGRPLASASASYHRRGRAAAPRRGRPRAPRQEIPQGDLSCSVYSLLQAAHTGCHPSKLHEALERYGLLGDWKRARKRRPRRDPRSRVYDPRHIRRPFPPRIDSEDRLF